MKNWFYKKKEEGISTTIKKSPFCKRYLLEIDVKYIASLRL